MPENYSNTALSANMEDYIETIAILCEETSFARVKDIAKSLNIKMPSVSAALTKLKEKGLIKYEKYGNIELTEAGKIAAKKVHSRHKIIASFLMQFLQLKSDNADKEACELEHYLSSETCCNISKLMSFFEKEKSENQEWIQRLNDYLK